MYDLRIRYRDNHMAEADIKTLDLNVTILPVNEPPEVVGETSQSISFEEDDGVRETINLRAYDQEGDRFRWMVKTVPTNAHPLVNINYVKNDGTIISLPPHTGSAGSTGGSFTEFVDFNDSVTFYIDNNLQDSFGTLTYQFIPFDEDGDKEGAPYSVTVSIENDFTDPISLSDFFSPEGYPVLKHSSIEDAYLTSWHENRTGSFIDFHTETLIVIVTKPCKLITIPLKCKGCSNLLLARRSGCPVFFH